MYTMCLESLTFVVISYQVTRTRRIKKSMSGDPTLAFFRPDHKLGAKL